MGNQGEDFPTYDYDSSRSLVEDFSNKRVCQKTFNESAPTIAIVEHENHPTPHSKIHDHRPINSSTGSMNNTSCQNDEEEVQPEPPDGGYGWMVVLGCFLSHIVLAGLDRGDGIFFLLFLERYQHSAQLTAWPGAIATTLQQAVGPLANAVSSRYSVRTTVILGTALAVVGLILNGLAPNIYFLFFSHALVGGFGRGLFYAPGLIIVGMYFKKRIGLATGIATAGGGIGTFVIVPFVQFLYEAYGYQGVFLLIGGLTCNMMVAAMLYRPLSMHFMITKKESRYEKVPDTNTESQDDTLNAEDIMSSTHADSDSEVEMSKSLNSRESRRFEGAAAGGNLKTQVEHQNNYCASSLEICFPIERMNKSGKKALFHLYLLKHPPFLMFCLSICLYQMSVKAALTFIPALVKANGNSDMEAALTLSVAGATDTVGRIAAGIIMELSAIRHLRPVLYNSLIFGMAAVAFLLPSMSAFSSFAIMCGIFGMLTGAYISQKSVVLVDILGLEQMGNSLGLLLFFQGVGGCLGPPLSGALKDIFGTYDGAFYLGGAIVTSAGLLMAVCNVLLRLKR